jgi:hypothetical protein
MFRRTLVTIFVLVGLFLAAGAASAQSLGTYRWQLTPYCNVITLQVTQVGSQYRFEGNDNQCGVAGAPAPVTGLAVPAPGGMLGFGIAIVTPQGPVHVHVNFNINALGGTWRDNSGNTGVLVYLGGGAPGAGAPRPAPSPVLDGTITSTKLSDGAVDGSKILDGSVGSADINATQVQTRVEACPAGQTINSVAANGTVTCITTVGPGNGTITGVTAGTGLTGGGIAGTVGLNVNFAGPGTAATAAHSDHTHLLSADNVGIGPSALSAAVLGQNTAVGYGALQFAPGIANTAIGHEALHSNSAGEGNVAVGAGALRLVTGLDHNDNTALGSNALANLTTGRFNIAIGTYAGSALTSAPDPLTQNRDNIYIDNPGLNLEEGTIRIGDDLWHLNRTFIAGVHGVSVPGGDFVVIGADGRLGSVPASSLTSLTAAPLSGNATTDSSLAAEVQRLQTQLDAQAREIAALRVTVESLTRSK